MAAREGAGGCSQGTGGVVESSLLTWGPEGSHRSDRTSSSPMAVVPSRSLM